MFIKNSPTKNELENIATHLYNGFYCFEAITARNIDDGICGICGVIGEVYTLEMEMRKIAVISVK